MPFKCLKVIITAHLSDTSKTNFAAWNTKTLFSEMIIVGTCTYNMQGAPKLILISTV